MIEIKIVIKEDKTGIGAKCTTVRKKQTDSEIPIAGLIFSVVTELMEYFPGTTIFTGACKTEEEAKAKLKLQKDIIASGR